MRILILFCLSAYAGPRLEDLRVPASDSVKAIEEFPLEKLQIKDSSQIHWHDTYYSRNPASGVSTYMRIRCSSLHGKPYPNAQDRYADCLEGESFDRDYSVFHPDGQKSLEMGIIFSP